MTIVIGVSVRFKGDSLTAILGISAFYHDSAAALLIDGKLVAAAQEERFSRIKHDPSFPRMAVKFCLKQAGITVEELDQVAFYEKPFLKFERLLETFLNHAPRGIGSFFRSMPIWLKSKLYLSKAIRDGLSKDTRVGVGPECGGRFEQRIVFPKHHQSHAASAFYPSPFERAAILTVDGVGEWATATLAQGEGNRISITDELMFPDSLGLLYSAFTFFCGFHPNGGEGKLMGLAPYGEPIYAKRILRDVVDVKDDGSLRLNQEFFDYCVGRQMTSPQFGKLFGGPRRIPEATITQREKDIAASIQVVAESILLKMANHLHSKTGMKNLCIAGGVGLNCVANGRVRRESPFDRVWVQPAAGDSGGAIGAALFVWHQLLNRNRTIDPSFSVSLGPSSCSGQVEELLRRTDANFKKFPDNESLFEVVATLLAEQKTVGWFQGRMEFGPRALGNRSILADPRDPEMQDKLNQVVKFREPFRPFAPVVLKEKYQNTFDTEEDDDSPFMLFASPVRQKQGQGREGTALTLGAVTHVDGSARVQTVTEEQNLRLYGLLRVFEAQTSCPVLLNTSFNVRGKPIVGSIVDALECFVESGLDAVVLENLLLQKEELSELAICQLGELTDRSSDVQRPALFARIKSLLMTVSFPLRFLISHTVLTAIYYLLITPVGVAVRLKRSSFQAIDREVDSYWQPSPGDDDKTDYLKQY